MRKKKEYTPEKLAEMVRVVLEEPYWLSELSSEDYYERVHDDHDGTFEGRLGVTISVDGDVWVTTGIPPQRLLRFRNYYGGGQSLRVHNALKILALAIKLDNEEYPQA